MFNSVIPIRLISGEKWIHIREICGFEEQSILGTRTIDAICLLDQIISPNPENKNLISQSSQLTIYDRDRIFIEVYANTFGPKIETSVACSSCTTKFDISFPLDELVSQMEDGIEIDSEMMSNPFPFKTPEGFRFRLPTGEDELAVMGMNPGKAESELLKRCIPEENGNIDTESLQKEMKIVAPLADIELNAQCPECSMSQLLHFNIQQYFLSSLIQEKDQLVREVHLLARFYGWGLNEILDLPRSMRRKYVSLATNNH